MAARICPQCRNVVPATRVVALSDGMECPHCQARLEVSRGSRLLATAIALIVGWLVLHFANFSGHVLGWILPEVFAIIAFGVVAPLLLMLIADLRLAPAVVIEPAPAAAGHGHAAAHH